MRLDVAYAYDAANRRTEQQVDADGTAGYEKQERYGVDGPDVLLVTDQGSAFKGRYVYGGGADQVLAEQTPADGFRWLVADHEGSIRRVMTLTGGTQRRLDYDAFGQRAASTAAGESGALPRHGFTGQQWDAASSLGYFDARYYQADAARFLNPDPAKDGTNLYAYAGNDPVNFTDASGLTAGFGRAAAATSIFSNPSGYLQDAALASTNTRSLEPMQQMTRRWQREAGPDAPDFIDRAASWIGDAADAEGRAAEASTLGAANWLARRLPDWRISRGAVTTVAWFGGLRRGLIETAGAVVNLPGQANSLADSVEGFEAAGHGLPAAVAMTAWRRTPVVNAGWMFRDAITGNSSDGSSLGQSLTTTQRWSSGLGAGGSLMAAWATPYALRARAARAMSVQQSLRLPMAPMVGATQGPIIGGGGFLTGGTVGEVMGGEQPLVLRPVGSGVAYLRTDLSGAFKPYVGQSISWERYLARQGEHAADFPGSFFKFKQLGSAAPGTPLDVLEESLIRQFGGPTNRSNPGGLLSNKRYQMNDVRYRAAGGTVNKP